MSDWIPVSQEPPLTTDFKSKRYVLAVDAKGRMSVGYARKYTVGYQWTFAKPIGDPTHWMLLPPVPDALTS